LNFESDAGKSHSYYIYSFILTFLSLLCT
jgi:hypothetical protein